MAPTTETLEGGGRRVQRISQGFRSILVMTCQPKFLHQPPPVKTTWPFFFLNVSVGVQLEECNWSFFYATRRYSVFPWSGDKSDLGRGGECSLSEDTTSANSGGSHMLGEIWENCSLCVVF